MECRRPHAQQRALGHVVKIVAHAQINIETLIDFKRTISTIKITAQTVLYLRDGLNNPY